MPPTLIFRLAQSDDGEVEVEVAPISAPEGGDGEVEVAPISAGEGEAEQHEEEVREESDDEVANPILPVGPELFWGAVLFMLLWALMKWVLLPPVEKTQEERADKVRDDRDAAERARAEIATLRQDHDAHMQAARTEANRLIDDARQAGEQRRGEVIGQVETEIAAERERANAEVETAKAAALEELKGGVADLAVEAAGLVVRRDIDRAANQQIIASYVDDAGSRT